MKSKKAILIVHGFAGNMNENKDLALFLENQNFDVKLFDLPGHGESKHVGKLKKEDWILAVENELINLINNNYEEIYLIGHSMGGVISSYLATKYPQVKKLVLLAPAFIYKNRLDIKTYQHYSFKYLFSSLRFTFTIKEFRDLVKEYHEVPKYITIPTLIIQGNSDVIVPIKSSKYVYENLKSEIKYLKIFENVTHVMFYSDKKDEIIETIYSFLTNNKV